MGVSFTNLNELLQQLILMKEKLTVNLKRCEEIIIEEDDFNIKEWEDNLKQKLAKRDLIDGSESDESDADFVEVSNTESMDFFR